MVVLVNEDPAFRAKQMGHGGIGCFAGWVGDLL